ncbi:glycoside hydrolase family 140 protein [candidate division KSB1 bacterium]|nr:glycoside hydrolase family 140 protein [candidate division KSB1 bacterium]
MQQFSVITHFLLFSLLFLTPSADARSLRVSANHRYLEYDDGAPFFYLGDTAWELFHRLNREEADLYLSNRSRKGFTVIQAVVLAERDGLTAANAYGELPLKDRDPAQPNDAYFRHVDYIVNKAAELGLYIGMLPTWGKYWSDNNPEQKIFHAGNARRFGEYLGKRYKGKPIIWILGGDHNIHTEGERAIVEAMALGLKSGDDGEHLITFHPRGPGLSSDYLHAADWLDFNMIQSSHGAHDHDNGLFVEHDYALSPAKPTLDGEPRYELIPVGFYFDGFNRQDWFNDYDCRQAAYWALLAGACGHTYGNNSVWQMYAPGRDAVLWARMPWSEALDLPGALQMGYVRKLFESRPFTMLRPAQHIILDGPRSGGGKIRAALAHDGSFAFIYSPRGERFTIDRNVIRSNKKIEIWYDPRYGVAHPIHTSDTAGLQTYTPPTSGRGCDWILIIEDAKKNYPLP